MNKVEKIKAEIKRRKSLADKESENMYFFARSDAYRELLYFIDSLEEEKISDDLEEAAESCMPECMWGIDVNGDDITENAYDFNQMIQMFKDGVDWKKKQMMKNAVGGEITVYVLSKHLKYDKGKFLNAWDRFNIGDKVKIIVIKED